MTDERLAELLPLLALGMLDGDDRVYVEARLAGGDGEPPELRAFERVVARIAFATDPVPPSPNLRPRVLKTALPVAGPATRRFGLVSLLTLAAAAVLAVSLLVMQGQRDAARARLAREQAFRALSGQSDSKVASLDGMPAAPKARGRVVWNPVNKEALLLASGLDRAPEGKAYEVWVIAQGAPVPAGTFQVDARGDAMFRLPALDDVAKVKTFAVTLEPAAGTLAPTGPMVLAGVAGS